MNPATEVTTTDIKGKRATAAAAIAEAPTPIVIAVPVGDIDESPTNPRITFRGLDELAADMKRVGVLQPGLARPSPRREAGLGRYELVFAARRFRAAKLAGLKDFPLMVRALTDEQVLEIQLAENGNREDVHPLEEADGYRRGIDTHGWTVEELAAKVGRPVGFVLQRLKYCSLVPAAREAFLAGELTAATALVVARIPSASVQDKALKEILTYSGRNPGVDPPTSKTDAAWVVRTKFMLLLAEAPFDRKDPSLVVGAPACGDCPKRTGKQRELFEDVDKKDDLCLDTVCFGAKRDAAWTKKRIAAEAKGQQVLPDAESKKAFAYGQIRHDSEYVDLEAKHYAQGVGKGQTYKSLLPKSADVPVILARDEEGRPHELVSKKVFAKLAPKAGIVAPRVEKDLQAAHRKREAKSKEKREEQRASKLAMAAEIGAKAEKTQPTDAFWRTLAAAYVRDHVDVWNGPELEELATKVLTKGPSAQAQKGGRVKLLDEVLVGVAKLKGDRARGLLVELLVGDEYSRDVTLAEFSALYRIKPVAKPKASAKKKARS